MSEILPNVFAAPRTATASFAELAPTMKVLALAGVWGIERNLLDKLRPAIPAEWIEFDAVTVIGLYAMGIPFGWVLLFLVGWTTAWASRILGHAVPAASVRAVMAASFVPRIGSVVLLSLLLAWTGEDFYRLSRSELIATVPGAALVIIGVTALDFWSLVVLILGLAEVGRMSIGRTLAVYALGSLPLILAVVLVVFALASLM